MTIADIRARDLPAVEPASHHGFSPESTSRRTIDVALLGCGTVAAAVARLLIDARECLRITHGIDVVLTRILVRDASKPRPGLDRALFTTEWREVLDASPDVVIEALGGREPAATLVKHALARGMSVVSANKTLIAHEWIALQSALQSGACRIARADASPSASPRLAFEACVGSAVPMLAALRQRRGDPLIALSAVLNGTCNFVLTRMSESGLPLSEVLKQATALGLAEPDPSADISGRDSAEKLAILARAAGLSWVTPHDILTTGMENITPRDLQAAREHGCVIRLIAEIEMIDGQPSLRVGPSLVPMAHPLAKAKGAENVIVLDQEHAGRLVLHGQGAGPRPTAAAILGDLLSVIDASEARPSPMPPASLRRTRARTFIRVAKGHDSAGLLGQHASHIDMRRDSVEGVVNHHAAIDPYSGAFVATMLA